MFSPVYISIYPMEATLHLLDSAKDAMRMQQLSMRTEIAYLDWIYRFFLFYGKRSPQELGEAEVGKFLNYITKDCKKSASTQNQAHCALLFLYNVVLKKPLNKINFSRLKNFRSLPEILTKPEIDNLLQNMEGVPKIVASLLYGCGLKIMEGISLRVQDVDFQNNKIRLKGRSIDLPQYLIPTLQQQITEVSQQFNNDVKLGFGEVDIPKELQKVNPEAGRSLAWQYVFPAVRRSVQLSSKKEIRYHLHESILQKALKHALELSNIGKKACCQSLRHSFAIHLLEKGEKLSTVQEILGHRNKRSTMIYSYIMQTIKARSENKKTTLAFI